MYNVQVNAENCYPLPRKYFKYSALMNKNFSMHKFLTFLFFLMPYICQAETKILDFPGYVVTYDNARFRNDGIAGGVNQIFDYDIVDNMMLGTRINTQLKSGLMIDDGVAYFQPYAPLAVFVEGNGKKQTVLEKFSVNVQAKPGWVIGSFETRMKLELIHSSGGSGAFTSQSKASVGWVLDDLDRTWSQTDEGYSWYSYTSFGIPSVNRWFLVDTTSTHKEVIVNGTATDEEKYSVRYVVDPLSISELGYTSDISLYVATDGSSGYQFSNLRATGPLQLYVTAYKQISSVPEPNTYFMYLMGLGAIWSLAGASRARRTRV